MLRPNEQNLRQVTFIMCIYWTKCKRVTKIRNSHEKLLIYKCITSGAL